MSSEGGRMQLRHDRVLQIVGIVRYNDDVSVLNQLHDNSVSKRKITLVPLGSYQRLTEVIRSRMLLRLFHMAQQKSVVPNANHTVGG